MRISDWSSDGCSSDLIVEAVDAGDAVADRQHLADLADRGVGSEIGDLVLDDLADSSGEDFHYSAFRRGQLGAFGRTGCQPLIACAKLLRRVRLLPSISWLPSWTTRPPRMAGSTGVATVTLRPTWVLEVGRD